MPRRLHNRDIAASCAALAKAKPVQAQMFGHTFKGCYDVTDGVLYISHADVSPHAELGDRDPETVARTLFENALRDRFDPPRHQPRRKRDPWKIG